VSRPARRINGRSPAPQPAEVRCAIYTRKSTEEGLDRDINSLSVQRQACEEYVRTRASDGWRLVGDQYDDGGWSGATVKRPGFQRLLADVEGGRVSCVVVHRVDRLSRSLLDFAQLMRYFQERGVAFVSVTQNFSTADPVGRLTLNLLATFAEFEREMISARTKDKIAASRRMGRWTGGRVPLGYDLKEGRLVINGPDAATVREIFDLYEETASLTGTVEELGRRDLTMRTRPGRPYEKPSVLRVLRSPIVAGLIRSGDALIKAEHEAIVDPSIWDRVQERLTRHGTAGYQGERENQHALLKGLLYCAQCGCRMSPTYTSKDGRRYRYYTCQSRIRRGAHACPTGQVAAHEIEKQVVDEIRAIGRDPDLIAGTSRQATTHRDELVARHEAEEKTRRRELRVKRAGLTRLRAKNGTTADLQVVQERIASIEARLSALSGETTAAKRLNIDEHDLARALEAFGPVWDALWPGERARILGLLVERIDYDGKGDGLGIRLQPGAIPASAVTGGCAAVCPVLPTSDTPLPHGPQLGQYPVVEVP
jgi:site-specific DNA recombinase